MKVKIKKLDPNAKLPFKKNFSDFCYDLYATAVKEVSPGVYMYNTGLSFQLVRETFSMRNISGNLFSVDLQKLKNDILLDIDVRPRSSIYKTGMVLANSEPTVDEDYTGEVKLIFYHIMKDLPIYEVGDRIGQMKIGFTVPCEFEVVDELDSTERGTGGFGSTGQK